MLRRVEVTAGVVPRIERPATRVAEEVAARAREIVERVRDEGDAALFELGRRYDGVELDAFEVTPAERAAARRAVARQARADMERAHANIRRFHAAQLASRGGVAVETSPGVHCELRTLPIQRVGLYVPGGRAPLFSTLFMLGVPARLAGCELRIACSPPRPDGSLDPHLCVAADLCGIERVFKVGGAQAIAAMAYGTASVPAVDKVFGPGNAWVTAAKERVASDPAGAARDLPAGPSEVLVVADETADPGFVAADLLSQAEHGPDSQVVLVTTSARLGDAVCRALAERLEDLPRAEIARAALVHSRLVVTADLVQAFEVVNAYAPEHLILQVEEPRAWSLCVRDAGSVFLGPWTPEAVGDYASGTNHVLPTYGHARAHGGLSVADFQKTITVQELEPEGLLDLGPVVERLSALEGLAGHGRAVSERLRRLPARDAREAGNGSDDDTVLRLARPEVLALEPYSSARSLSPEDGARVLLDANEGVPGIAPDLRRYPAPQPERLRTAVAELYGTAPDRFLMLRGADEGIDLLLRAFCRPGRDRVVVTPPTYGMYTVSARIQGALADEAPLARTDAGWSLDVPRLLSACEASGPDLRLVFLGSPNNPTGGTVAPGDVRRLCRALRGRAVVVVDEAYVEFSARASLVGATAELENLAVLRTLSKAWGAAGARFGLLFAAPTPIALLDKLRAPYPLATPVIEAVAGLLSSAGVERMRRAVRATRARREELAAALAELSLVERVYPSEANFLLVRARDGAELVARCARAGVVVRDLGHVPGLERCVRVSVGTEEEHVALLDALAEEVPFNERRAMRAAR